MAILHPFKAWHPSPKKVKRNSCPPYDVISTSEARVHAKGNSESFLHVIRPEIDVPEGTPFNDDKVYKEGVKNLTELINKGILTQDESKQVYIYRLIWKGKSQTGIFGCVSVDDYDNGVILKHELTRPDKEDDRTRHIIEQQAHAEPVMLTCKDDEAITSFIQAFCKEHAPLFDFTTEDNITHCLWKIPETENLVKIFAGLDHLYIADGHHRCKSASRAAHQERDKHPDYTGEEEFNFFPAVVFPMSELNILAYNRIIFNVPDDFKAQLEKRFTLQKTSDSTPSRKGDICVYLNGAWFNISLPKIKNPSAVEKLDVFRLQKFILEPLLGIKDQRTDENISFVGGIRGTSELKEIVDNGKADTAISMYPTEIDELVTVSDEGLLMPPKSTWFEPKLRSGLLIHTF